MVDVVKSQNYQETLGNLGAKINFDKTLIKAMPYQSNKIDIWML